MKFSVLPFLLAAFASGALAGDVVIDFEGVEILPADVMPHRYEEWDEQGVVFKLAHAPQQSKAKGLVMFFPHVSSGRKGIVGAMAAEPIPVQVTFPKAVSSVKLAMWGSTATPALIEAFDSDGRVVDRVEYEAIPGRKAPGEPVPIFDVTLKADRIAYVEFSGPRGEGEYLVADEVRFEMVEVERSREAKSGASRP